VRHWALAVLSSRSKKARRGHAEVKDPKGEPS
jgi:hypothetical protein